MLRHWMRAASTSRVPTMGPVQEKETNTSVNAMKKVPSRPPRSAIRSLLFTHEEGRLNFIKTKKGKGKNDQKHKYNQVEPHVRAHIIQY
jgi:hypothetical protein